MKDYTFYVSIAYGFAFVVIGFLTVKITLDYRELKKKLARFDGAEKDQ